MSATDLQQHTEHEDVRVRFPPSPTGLLHVGGARTALFNWLFAHGETRRSGQTGTLVIRIEDTDRSRYVPGASEGIYDILNWFGLTWEEGPDKGGSYGPYVQSERTDLYQQYAQQLIDEDKAYRCFCSSDRLAKVREEQRARSEAPGYDRHCRSLTREESAQRADAGESFVIRFKMPLTGQTVVNDLLRGEMVFQHENLEDLVLLKSDGYPTYHLANVVDDHLMGITHIMRGEEWIPTAPVHVQLYKAFGWEIPKIAHLPLILAPGGGKLSKRHGSTAMEEFRSLGYLPEALMNYLALLGWSFDGSTEMFSKEELLEKWSLERVNPSPATFDYDKLRWFNQQYINHVLSVDDLTTRVLPFLVEAGFISANIAPGSNAYKLVHDTVEILKDRIVLLSDAPDLMSFFLRDKLDAYDPALLIPKKSNAASTRDALVAVRAKLEQTTLANEAATEEELRALAKERDLKAGQLFMPIRVAVTGRKESPGLFETLRVIGDERVQNRIDQAITALEPLVQAET